MHWPAVEEAIRNYFPLFGIKLFGWPCSVTRAEGDRTAHRGKQARALNRERKNM